MEKGTPYRCHSQRFRGIGKILAAKVATAAHGPQRIADFREKEFRSDKCRFDFQQGLCLVGPFFLHKPFHDDAGIDHITRHLGLFRSRPARMISLLSMEDRRRCRSFLGSGGKVLVSFKQRPIEGSPCVRPRRTGHGRQPSV